MAAELTTTKLNAETHLLLVSTPATVQEFQLTEHARTNPFFGFLTN